MKITLIVKQGHNPGQELIVEKFPAIFGRADDCNYHIGESAVSRKHFLIKFDGGSFYIEDTNSSNGTFLNGDRLQQEMAIAEGDYIQAGALLVKVTSLTTIPSEMLEKLRQMKARMSSSLGQEDVSSSKSTEIFPGTLDPSKLQALDEDTTRKLRAKYLATLKDHMNKK